MSACVLELPPAVTATGNQMGGILVAEDAQGLVESALLDEAVGRQVST